MQYPTGIGRLLLVAILVAVLGALVSLAAAPQYTAYVVMAAVIAGLTLGTEAYFKGGADTKIPWRTLAALVWTAVLAAVPYILGVREWTIPAIIAGVVIIVTALLHETGVTTTPAPAPTVPPAAKP